jgi:ribosomal protein S18 acetylase RimI-like enzyme
LRIEVVDRGATRELRRAVLRPGWPVGSPMHGDDDPDAVHLAALDEAGQVVGSVLVRPGSYALRPEVAGAWQLRGMATAPERQGQGIGGRLIAAAVQQVRRRGGRLLWCDARTSAVGFYDRHGFIREGEEFRHAESGIPHYRMWRMLEPADAATSS